MSSTARFGLPLLDAGQAQKELTHNEALTLIDALVQPLAQAAGGETPPGDPDPGQCWIVGAAPEGDWAGAARALAIWTAGGWRFVAPREGMTVPLRADGITARYAAGEWVLGVISANEVVVAGARVIGPRQPAVGDPSGGTVLDAEARAAIVGVLDALRRHGLIAS